MDALRQITGPDSVKWLLNGTKVKTGKFGFHESAITSIHETHAEFNKRLELHKMSKVAGSFLQFKRFFFAKRQKKLS